MTTSAGIIFVSRMTNRHRHWVCVLNADWRRRQLKHTRHSHLMFYIRNGMLSLGGDSSQTRLSVSGTWKTQRILLVSAASFCYYAFEESQRRGENATKKYSYTHAAVQKRIQTKINSQLNIEKKNKIPGKCFQRIRYA